MDLMSDSPGPHARGQWTSRVTSPVVTIEVIGPRATCPVVSIEVSGSRERLPWCSRSRSVDFTSDFPDGRDRGQWDSRVTSLVVTIEVRGVTSDFPGSHDRGPRTHE